MRAYNQLTIEDKYKNIADEYFGDAIADHFGDDGKSLVEPDATPTLVRDIIAARLQDHTHHSPIVDAPENTNDHIAETDDAYVIHDPYGFNLDSVKYYDFYENNDEKTRASKIIAVIIHDKTAGRIGEPNEVLYLEVVPKVVFED